MASHEQVMKFCRKYAAEVRESSRRYRSASRVPVNGPVTATEYLERNMVTETGVDITLPRSTFDVLVEHQDELEEQLIRYGFEGAIHRKLNQIQADAMIRARNPAVREAYEKYKVLLELSR